MDGKPRSHLVRDFTFAYLIVTAFRTVPKLRRKANVQKIVELFIREAKRFRVLKEALFLVALPRAYGFFRRRYPTSVVPALLSAPLLQLIEPSLQRTCAVYVATAAAVNFGRGSRLRQILPPTWTLIIPANTWLLWAFLFQRRCFPHAYGDLILRYSGYGSGVPTEQLVDFLQHTKFEQYPLRGHAMSEKGLPLNVHPKHTRAVCARLHPTTLSCLETYTRALVTEFPKVWKWVGAFGALALLLRRPRIFLESPRKAFRDWFISTTRGTAFVVGTINTCWGLTCLLQRFLSPGSLPRIRWIVNGLLGNLWVLVLPAARRTDFALYCTRLTLRSLWDLTGLPARYGENLVVTVAWASLLRDRRIGIGPQGLGGLIMDYIDSHATDKLR